MILEYAKMVNANEEVINWLNTTAKKQLDKQNTTISELEHIVDYLVSPKAPKRLQKMSFVDAKRKAAEWSKTNQKKGRNLIDTDDDIQVIHDFFDGTKIVKLKSQKAYKREGFFMSHCLGGYSLSNDIEIYSYRDAKNLPHATFELRKKSNEIMQIKGKGNGPIHPKYIHPILTFLQIIGIKIRPYDMRNLGYYHIDSELIPYLKTQEKYKNQIVVINNENYVAEIL